MSALGQKRTLMSLHPMSALPPKADIAEYDWDVRFVPKADIMQYAVQQPIAACTVEFSPVGGEGCKAAKGPNTSNCPIWRAWGRQKSASRSGSIKEHTCLAAPLCNVQGPFRIMVAIGFDLREVQSSLQSSVTKQNGEQR
jgi:hypothetical protein